MPGTLWVVAEVGADGRLARISAEVATLVRRLGEPAGRDVVGIVVASPSSGGAGAAEELALYLPRVLAVEDPTVDSSPIAAVVAGVVAGLVAGDPTGCVFVGASPDGRDIAGFLSAMLGVGVLANAAGVTWDDGPVVEKGVFGGRLVTTSSFTDGHGIVTVALGSTAAEAAPTPGRVEAVAIPDGAPAGAPGPALPAGPPVVVLERVTESAGAV